MGFPGESLLIRLWDTLEKSGVGLFQPWQSKRVGKAEAEVAANRILAIGLAEKKIAELKSGVSSDALQLELAGQEKPTVALVRAEPEMDFSDITWNSARSQTIEQLRREVNIEKAIANAEHVLSQDSASAPKEEVDADWFFRWRECAGGMSNEQLQQLWGNVLAGELKAPGSFTYRTLDFLRNLSQDEAKLIERLASIAFDRRAIYYGLAKGKFNMQSTSFPEILHSGEMILLDELGLVNGVSTMGYIENADPLKAGDGRLFHLLECNGRGILATTDDPKKPTALQFYLLTKLGRSVLRLVQTVPDESNLLEIAKALADVGFEVKVGDVSEHPAGGRSFTNERVVTASVGDSVSAPSNP
jgi:hypothetical protein